jgi:hypothetical protein
LPVLLYPANYYIHFGFLLPLIPLERKLRAEGEAPVSATDAGVWLTLLAMCGVQYFTVLVPDLGLHFYLETAVLFAMLTLVPFLLVYPEIPGFLENLAVRVTQADRAEKVKTEPAKAVPAAAEPVVSSGSSGT